MPPRTRKTADAPPPAADTATASDAAQIPAPDGDAQAAAADQAVSTEVDTTAQEPDASAELAEPIASQPLEPVADAPAYHWETPDGRQADPCRLCPPGGPPPGAGSYGCPHGQWVRVQDAA